MKAGVIGGAIGGVERLSLILEGFNPKAVMDKYAGDWEAILNDIVERVEPRGEVRRTPPAFGRTTVRQYFPLLASLSSFRRRRTSSVGWIFLTETIEHVKAYPFF